MSRTKKITNNKKMNKNIYSNGLLNMNVIVKYFKSYNITNYKYYNNMLIYKHNNIIITINVNEFDTTNTILQMIKFQINKNISNECIICYNTSDDLKGCPQCLNFMCLDCCNKIYDINDCFVCPICRFKYNKFSFFLCLFFLESIILLSLICLIAFL